MSKPQPVLDTPTRAARVTRPQTRAWKQLISDATTRTTTAATQRARLRAHLAAADRLAAKRRALRATTSHNVPREVLQKKKEGLLKAEMAKAKEKDGDDAKDRVESEQLAKKLKFDDSVEKPGAAAAEKEEEEVGTRPLFTPDAAWTDQMEALTAYKQSPSAEGTRALAAVLPQVLRDLRGQIVVAGSEAAVAAAPFLQDSPEMLTGVLDAAFKGASVTKQVMAKPCERATLALLRDVTDKDVWQHVLKKVEGEDHVAVRALAVKTVTQLAEHGSPARIDFIMATATDCLRVAAQDKMVQVRDAARQLVAQVRSRFGQKHADTLLNSAIPAAEVRLRFAKPANKKVLGNNQSMPSKQAKSSNLREMIKARKAAAAKAAAAAAAAANTKTDENAEVVVGNGSAELEANTAVLATLR